MYNYTPTIVNKTSLLPIKLRAQVSSLFKSVFSINPIKPYMLKLLLSNVCHLLVSTLLNTTLPPVL